MSYVYVYTMYILQNVYVYTIYIGIIYNVCVHTMYVCLHIIICMCERDIGRVDFRGTVYNIISLIILSIL